MDFKVKREALKTALASIQSIVERKSTKPILANALLTCQGESLSIHATDLEIGMKLEIPSQNSESASIAVPAKNLYEIIREITAEDIHFRRKDDHWLEILAERSKFKIAVLDPREFPNMPESTPENFATIDAKQMGEMIQKTLFAISTDENKYNLNGLLLENTEDKKYRMVATDGHRLSFLEREFEHNLAIPKNLLLPRKGVLEIQKLISAGNAPIALQCQSRNLIVLCGGTTLYIRLMEGEFPDYRKIIPKEQPYQALLPRQAWISALRRVSLLSQEHHRGVKLTLSAGFLELLCVNPELGEAREEIECQYKGKHFEIGFNYRYLLDVLTALDDDTVILHLKDEVSPCVIGSDLDPGFTALIMPMRL